MAEARGLAATDAGMQVLRRHDAHIEKGSMVPLSTHLIDAEALDEPLDFVVLITPSTRQERYRTSEQPFERG
jgi:hypothetical protein